MVNESQYMILERPFIPDEDTLVVVLRKGTVRRPLNRLEDQVVEMGMALGVSSNDDLYTWGSFRSMVENEYGNLLSDALEQYPNDPPAAIAVWLVDYLAAHVNPQNTLDGWDGSGYLCPEGEPMSGLVSLPPA